MLKLDSTQHWEDTFSSPFTSKVVLPQTVFFLHSRKITASRLHVSSKIINNSTLKLWFSATSVIYFLFSQWYNWFHVETARMNTKQTVENSACISTVNHEGHAWFRVVGQTYPWEISQREQSGSALVQLPTHTAPLGISPGWPPPSATNAHQHSSPWTTPSSAQGQATIPPPCAASHQG